MELCEFQISWQSGHTVINYGSRFYNTWRLLMADPVYALNLFNVADRDDYLAYSRRSAKEVQAHGGRVVALGKFREAV
jgi:hypothetical protein